MRFSSTAARVSLVLFCFCTTIALSHAQLSIGTDPAVQGLFPAESFQPGGNFFPNDLQVRGSVIPQTVTSDISVLPGLRVQVAPNVFSQSGLISGTTSYSTDLTNLHTVNVHSPFDIVSTVTGTSSYRDDQRQLQAVLSVRAELNHPANGYDGPRGGGFPEPSSFGAIDNYFLTIKGQVDGTYFSSPGSNVGTTTGGGGNDPGILVSPDRPDGISPISPYDGTSSIPHASTHPSLDGYPVRPRGNTSPQFMPGNPVGDFLQIPIRPVTNASTGRFIYRPTVPWSKDTVQALSMFNRALYKLYDSQLEELRSTGKDYGDDILAYVERNSEADNSLLLSYLDGFGFNLEQAWDAYDVFAQVWWNASYLNPMDDLLEDYSKRSVGIAGISTNPKDWYNPMAGINSRSDAGTGLPFSPTDTDRFTDVTATPRTSVPTPYNSPSNSFATALGGTGNDKGSSVSFGGGSVTLVSSSSNTSNFATALGGSSSQGFDFVGGSRNSTASGGILVASHTTSGLGGGSIGGLGENGLKGTTFLGASSTVAAPSTSSSTTTGSGEPDGRIPYEDLKNLDWGKLPDWVKQKADEYLQEHYSSNQPTVKPGPFSGYKLSEADTRHAEGIARQKALDDYRETLLKAYINQQNEGTPDGWVFLQVPPELPIEYILPEEKWEEGRKARAKWDKIKANNKAEALQRAEEIRQHRERNTVYRTNPDGSVDRLVLFKGQLFLDDIFGKIEDWKYVIPKDRDPRELSLADQKALDRDAASQAKARDRFRNDLQRKADRLKDKLTDFVLGNTVVDKRNIDEIQADYLKALANIDQLNYEEALQKQSDYKNLDGRPDAQHLTNLQKERERIQAQINAGGKSQQFLQGLLTDLAAVDLEIGRLNTSVTANRISENYPRKPGQSDQDYARDLERKRERLLAQLTSGNPQRPDELKQDYSDLANLLNQFEGNSYSALDYEIPLQQREYSNLQRERAEAELIQERAQQAIADFQQKAEQEDLVGNLGKIIVKETEEFPEATLTPDDTRRRNWANNLRDKYPGVSPEELVLRSINDIGLIETMKQGLLDKDLVDYQNFIELIVPAVYETRPLTGETVSTGERILNGVFALVPVGKGKQLLGDAFANVKKFIGNKGDDVVRLIDDKIDDLFNKSGLRDEAGAIFPNTSKGAIPTVTDQKLNNFVDNLYKGAKGPNPIGSGSTADAVRNEILTGLPTKGRFHTQKAQETVNGLTNWLRNNPNASRHDREVATILLNDLKAALRGN